MESMNQNQPAIARKVKPILAGGFLFGLAWQLRGSGASDPAITLVILLLFLKLTFGPKAKLHPVVLGVAIMLFRVMRPGWGTLVSQAGIPGLFSGYITVDLTGINIQVAWWQGYFWLFIVGIAWGGLVALILGGFFLSERSYNWKDFVLYVTIYLLSAAAFYFLAQIVIPFIAPEAYYEVYIGMGSTRNYIAMVDNLTFALAILPVLLYIWFVKRDPKFAKRSGIIMLIFGTGLSVADIWQALGRNILENIPFWSLWEYFSGFIMGLLFLIFYFRFRSEVWEQASVGFSVPAPDTSSKLVGHYIFGHGALFLYGIADSIAGTITLTSTRAGNPFEVQGVWVMVMLILVDLPIYILYIRGFIWKGFASKDSGNKSHILLVIMVFFAFTCYFIALLPLFPTLFDIISHADVWLNTISFIIVSWYLLKRSKGFRTF